MNAIDLFWTAVAFFLTLCIFSYALGDNPFFRLATHLFIGVAAGYIVVVLFNQVLWPKLGLALLLGTPTERLLTIVPAVLSLLMLAKLIPGTARAGNLSMGFLVGAGAAVTIGGAITGTLFPQTMATINLFNLRNTSAGGALAAFLEGLFVLVGSAVTLIYFYFGARKSASGQLKRPIWIETMAKVGEIFIAVTFGALFAGVFVAAMTALLERATFLWNTIHLFF